MFSLGKGTNPERALISNKSFHHEIYNLLLLRSICTSFRKVKTKLETSALAPKHRRFSLISRNEIQTSMVFTG